LTAVSKPNAIVASGSLSSSYGIYLVSIGSGDQFLKTWKRGYSREKISFSQIQKGNSFCAIYLSLVSTEFGIDNIRRDVRRLRNWLESRNIESISK